jgi:Epoxide hydrolase N terminus
MSDIKPFKISVSDDKINRLKQKLALADFPDEVVDEKPWVRGPPLSDIKRLTHRWANGYDWRKAEADLNKFPQYMTKIPIDDFDTYDVHFIHQPSTVKNAIPLVFSHGWPGSFIEVTRILPELVKGGKDYPAFHVVAPSLLDYGFSEASKKKGFNIDQHAEMFHKLMLKLGYNEYGNIPRPRLSPSISTSGQPLTSSSLPRRRPRI